jgi:hypothetical protein
MSTSAVNYVDEVVSSTQKNDSANSCCWVRDDRSAQDTVAYDHKQPCNLNPTLE